MKKNKIICLSKESYLGKSIKQIILKAIKENTIYIYTPINKSLNMNKLNKKHSNLYIKKATKKDIEDIILKINEKKFRFRYIKTIINTIQIKLKKYFKFYKGTYKSSKFHQLMKALLIEESDNPSKFKPIINTIYEEIILFLINHSETSLNINIENNVVYIEKELKNKIQEIYNSFTIDEYKKYILSNIKDKLTKEDLLKTTKEKYNIMCNANEVDEILNLNNKIINMEGEKIITVNLDGAETKVSIDKDGLIENNVEATIDFYSFLLYLMKKTSNKAVVGISIAQIINENENLKVYCLGIVNSHIQYISPDTIKNNIYAHKNLNVSFSSLT